MKCSASRISSISTKPSAIPRPSNDTTIRTGVLDAALREHTVAPVRDAAHSLDAARPAYVAPLMLVLVVLRILLVAAEVQVEMVPEVPAHLVPSFTVGMTLGRRE